MQTGGRPEWKSAGRSKKYRTELKLSQEELADKIYVTRQTVSNWENDKNYPDIHSLVLLSSLFGISLDDLVKGDVKEMEEEIKTEDAKKLKRDGWIYFMLLCVTVVSAVPLIVGLWPAGAVVWLAVWGITMLHAHSIEKKKKAYDIQTYKEIKLFMSGRRLDEIEKLREEGKRPYQKWVFVLIAAAIAAAVMGAGLWIMNRIGML